MDQIKIGKFIAELRKCNNWTQQQLGDKIGVTNKTISRWENGNYMPDIEMLQILSQVFNVSINELLAGQKLTDKGFKKSADENILAISKQSAFSFEEKKRFWINKWRREHIGLLALIVLLDIAYLIICNVVRPALVPMMGIIIMVEYAWQNNKMMIYVENRLYRKQAKE
ncbi:MAG: helix-turn-helix domain-containing protein [Oscillospiraceae bacterium]|nr:helix-turn-helix domain-containing protein [Oscillospiraceae bacterium]